jgi:hypothetical protein
VCDWNADGLRDILIGDRNGYTMIFRETGSGLVLYDTLRDNSGVIIMVNFNSNPDVVDWNGDGKKDLIIGEETPLSPNTGTIRLYLNIGTNAAPVFSAYSMVTCGGVQINHYRTNPRVFDLDRDGKKDLLVGEDDGRIYFYRNTGTNNSPAFSTKDSLFLNTGAVLDMYYGTRFCIVDWKGDGDYDILGSDYDGFIYYFENATIVGAEEHEGSGAPSALVVSPNPARSRVTIGYEVAEPGKVRCDVYSVDGRRVATPFDRWENTGAHCGSWDVADLAAGVYLVKLTSNGETLTRSVLVTR